MPQDRSKHLFFNETEPRMPEPVEAHWAACEAETLTGLLYLAGCKSEELDVVDDNTISNGALMLLERVNIMRAFIVSKSDEEDGLRKRGIAQVKPAVVGGKR